MDGRQPHRDDPATPSANPNVFDDEFAVDTDPDGDFGSGVADGFRPDHASDGPVASNSAANAVPLDHRSSVRRSINENFPPDTKDAPAPAPPQPRNSIAKGGHAPRGSLTMANDGSNSQQPDHSSTYVPPAFPRTAPLQHRASVASTSSFATSTAGRSQDAFADNSGPSHPYAMYPQDTGLVRSSSVTTTSTVRAPQRSYSGQGPTHPYAMYPQNVVEDPDEIRAAPLPNAIPVGFPGLAREYHRRIGPDGEEQDIIGPDGHMEQLPPYSRFPEEGPTKASLLAVPEELGLPATEATTAAGVAVAGAADAAAVTSNSQDTLLSTGSAPVQNHQTASGPQQDAQQQPEQRNGISDTSSTLAGTENGNEKVWADATWREKKNKRILWGKVPLWAFITAVVIIVILAVVLGAVIGSFMTRQRWREEKKQDDPAMVTVVSTYSMFDASSIAIPTGLPSLPLGIYALPLRSPDVSSNECLPISNQTNAWSCDVEGPPLEVTVETTAKTINYTLGLQPLQNTTELNYGTQAPNIDPQALSLVTDLDDPSDGPAWHFQSVYNKVVILRPEDFGAGQNLRKRHANAHAQEAQPNGQYEPSGFVMPIQFRHRNQVVAGDTPWYCIWNGTFIEVFIYVEQNTTSANSAVTTGSASSPAASTSPGPSATSAQTSPVTSPAVATTTSAPNHARRRDASSTDINELQWYPRLIKMEERRMPDSAPPYCQKMQLLDDGRMVAYKDSTGGTVVVQLTENDPSYSDYANSGSSRRLIRREDPSNACHCQWTFT